MNEGVLRSVIWRDEAEAPGRVEEFYGANSHLVVPFLTIMTHSKSMPKWDSAHQIPGVSHLGQSDQANTPDHLALVRDMWRARGKIANDIGRASSLGLRQRHRGDALYG